MRKLILTVISALVIFFNIESIAWAKEEYIVRKEHPRIWLTPERLEFIKTKMNSNDPDFQAVKNAADRGDVLCSALMYVLTKEESYAKKAIDHLIKWECGYFSFDKPGSGSSDNIRWTGHVSIIIYDWCYDAIGDKDRSDFIKKYNSYIEAFNKRGYNAGPSNNYYGGYIRNSGLYGIATYYENERAKEFLEHARIDRWEKSSLPYFQKDGKGGVFGEGPGYSSDTARSYIYYIDAVKTGTGEDLLSQTSFFLENLYYLIYSTTPSPTFPTPPSGVANPYYHFFPSGDLENCPGGCSGPRYYHGDAALKMANNYKGKSAGEHSWHWLRKANVERGEIFNLIFNDSKQMERSFSDLPLDYYATGVKQLYSRSDWIEDATAISIQANPKQEHGHIDAGSFQICRKGRWLTKEATGYCIGFKDCGCNHMAAHNGILLGDKGPVGSKYSIIGDPEVVCLESHPAYVYIAYDLSVYYNFWYWKKIKGLRSPQDPWDGPSKDFKVERVVREFLYLRPDTLIILDRLQSKEDDKKKTFLLHFVEESVKIDKEKQVVVGKSGDQVLSCYTLLPNKPDYSVVNMREGVKKITDDATYTWRTDISSAEKEKEIFLNVLRGSDKEEEYDYKLVKEDGKVGVKYTDNGKTYTVLFKDDIDKVGGHITIEKDGKKLVDKDLYNKVQDVKVDENGVHWEEIK